MSIKTPYYTYLPGGALSYRIFVLDSRCVLVTLALAWAECGAGGGVGDFWQMEFQRVILIEKTQVCTEKWRSTEVFCPIYDRDI